MTLKLHRFHNLIAVCSLLVPPLLVQHKVPTVGANPSSLAPAYTFHVCRNLGSHSDHLDMQSDFRMLGLRDSFERLDGIVCTVLVIICAFVVYGAIMWTVDIEAR